MINVWICDWVWHSCTQHLTRLSYWDMVVWKGNCGNRPALFTKILNDCRERLQPTLNKSNIFSYACREHSTVLVPERQVAIKGFLKMWGTKLPPIKCDSGHCNDAYSMTLLSATSIGFPLKWGWANAKCWRTDSKLPPADHIGPLCPRREFCNHPVQLAPCCS